MPENVIELKNLSLRLDGVVKEYVNFTLGPVMLRADAGDVLAILGPNGAGKSTLFQMTSGHADTTDGEVFLGDYRLNPNAYDLKRRVGYLPQDMDLPAWVSGWELLGYAASLHELSEPQKTIEGLLASFDCQSFVHKPLASLSHGMRKRIGLVLTLLHTPALLILDEPFSGLDLFHLKALEDIIAQRSRDGLITILSTHIADYAAKLCTQAYVLQAGQLASVPDWNTSTRSQRVAKIEEYFFDRAPDDDSLDR